MRLLIVEDSAVQRHALRSILAGAGYCHLEEAATAAEAFDVSREIRPQRCGSSVLQKTFLRVDEKSTEAAAVTVVEIRVSARARSWSSTPGLLAIYDHATDSVLFLSQITDTTGT